MDLAKIQKLLKIVSESGVAEVEVEEDDFKLTIRQNAPTVMMQPAMPSYGMPYPTQGMPPQAAGGYPMPNASQQAPPSAPQQQNASQPAPVQNNSNAGSTAPADTTESTNEDGDVSVSADEHVITAELVGTFYRAPSPDAEPFVEVGDRIEEGDVLCIIEAMKIMNEIECETPGTIKKVLVDNAEPVEFDQPLFVIEPA
jgi:acetyl-CoA carboxylase biotin carboxyl carrier protein